MTLRDLIDDVEVPATRVAGDAWERGQSRLRRRRVLTVGAAGIAVVTTLVAVAAIPGGQRAESPAPPVGTPSLTTSTEPAEEHLPVMITRPNWTDLGTAPELAPGAGAAALSDDPVAHAVLVAGDPNSQAGAFVLGDDGTWRRLDVEGLVPVTDGLYNSSIVTPTGLDSTGTRLAIPQPDSLVVVDLTTGGSRRFEVKGPNHYVLWVDETHLLVGQELDPTGTLVDTTSGATEPSDLGPTSRVLADGSVLTWPRGSSDYTWNGATISSAAANNGGIILTSPLVRDGLAVVTHTGGIERDPPLPYPPPVMTSTVGIAAVDLASGDPVGYLPLSSTAKGTMSVLLGWQGDNPVLGLVYEKLSSLRLFVAVWDPQAGTLDPLATLPTWSATWGVGL